MKRPNLISLITVAVATLIANGANAQEKLADNAKQYSIGPAIEFGGAGTAFGIKGKIGVGQQFSIRPMVLFGYKPSVSASDLLNGSINVDGSAAQNGLPTTVKINTLGNLGIDTQTLADVGSGIGYGIAFTYDFKSPDGKIQGYVGPRILFGSASRSTTAAGLTAITSTSETNIGLTAGTDFTISDNFTAGVDATYNFSRSGTFSATFPGGSINAPISGGNFKFGVNFAYNF
jgi:opacity protein-like surface antigen